MNNTLRTFQTLKKVEIYGKRWFQRSYGNTYFSVEIHINNNFVHKIDYQYGYGDQFQHVAFKWLKENGYVKTDENTWSWRYFKENNIEYSVYAQDVKRKKDL